VRRALRRNAVSLHLKPTVGFAASLLAVWCQVLLLATISLAPLDIVGAGPGGDVPICHAGDGTQPAQQKPDHPAHDCALCVICLSHASPLAILAPPPQLPEWQLVATTRRAAAYPRAPPARLVAAAQPRGPPS
jgi:hypothetical protein